MRTPNGARTTSSRNPALDRQLRQREKDIKEIIELAVSRNTFAAQKSANEGARRVRELLNRSGDYKQTQYDWGTHWSSRPGEPPAKGTGHLASSIVSGKVTDGNPAVAYFGSTARYAVPLEFGHKGPKPAAPRPFMRTVAGDPGFRQYIRSTVAEYWRQSIITGVSRVRNASYRP